MVGRKDIGTRKGRAAGNGSNDKESRMASGEDRARDVGVNGAGVTGTAIAVTEEGNGHDFRDHPDRRRDGTYPRESRP